MTTNAQAKASQPRQRARDQIARDSPKHSIAWTLGNEFSFVMMFGSLAM